MKEASRTAGFHINASNYYLSPLISLQCVCGVYRAHILQSEMCDDDSIKSDEDEYAVFYDLESHRSRDKRENHSDRRQRRYAHCASPRKSHGHGCKPGVPSLEEVTTFYRDVFTRAKMETDCIIMSLIYVERLIKTTGGKLRPNAENWRSILFSCMVLSSKVWDDLSMWNADFSQTCPAGVRFRLKRVNELEVAVLSALSYNVKVLASEYAKYYFLMRSMVIKSGLGGQDAMTPLDVEGAKRLQQVSASYQSSTKTSAPGYVATRSKSVGAIGVFHNFPQATDGIESTKLGKAVLEHVVGM